MIAARLRGALSVGTLLIAAACGGGTSEPPGTTDTPTAVSVISGNGQTGLIGTTLSLPLTVKVTSGGGSAVSGATVNFAVTTGAASVAPATATTDATGTAKTIVTLGSSAGTVQITATVAGTSLTTTFAVTAGTGTITSACTGATPQAPTVGTVLPGLGGTGICLAGGTTGAEYALVVFNGNPDSSVVTSMTVKSTGAAGVTTASIAPASNEAPLGSPLRLSTTDFAQQFEVNLRESARRDLAPRIPAARARYKAQSAASVIPASVSIGQMITMNTAQSACSNITNVRGRVAAITSGTVIVADSLNPSGGFTDAEYASFATTFDTLINALDVATFGQPTDIDKNGKVVILFTKEVNKLTPRGSSGFVGGFVHERDLFPLTKTGDLDGCAGSNVGEMAYLLVPDPNSAFGDARSKADVLGNTIGTLTHEYQHLINAGRRLYINNADDFEHVWLNEGLSHIAEELLYYRVTGRGPRQNIGISVIGADQGAVTNFNLYAADNFGRYEVFLGKPDRTSVYAGNDELETRGATWNLLRYLADHRGSSDGDVWTKLVNSPLAGQKNLASVFGANYMTQIRDWATSVFSDDISTVTDARFLEPSWNMRSIFPRLLGSNNQPLNKFPLGVIPLSDGAPANLSVNAGGAAYLRFSVAAGGQASIDWSAAGLPVSPLVQFTIVRSK